MHLNSRENMSIYGEKKIKKYFLMVSSICQATSMINYKKPDVRKKDCEEKNIFFNVTIGLLGNTGFRKEIVKKRLWRKKLMGTDVLSTCQTTPMLEKRLWQGKKIEEFFFF